MEINTEVQNKKDIKITLRKIMFPLGIITSCLAFIFMMATWANCFVFFKEDLLKTFWNTTRYLAIPTISLALILGGIMLTCSIFQYKEINKVNIKTNIMLAVINTIISAALIIAFCVCIYPSLDTLKWNNAIYRALLGVVFAASLYSAIYAWTFNSKNIELLNMDKATQKCLSLFAIILASIIVIPASLSTIGTATKSPQWETIWYELYVGADLIYSFALVNIFITILIYIVIFAYVVLSKNKKNIIIWSVNSGVALILYVLAAVFWLHWSEKNMPFASAFMIFAWIGTFVASIFGYRMCNYEAETTEANNDSKEEPEIKIETLVQPQETVAEMPVEKEISTDQPVEEKVENSSEQISNESKI